MKQNLSKFDIEIRDFPDRRFYHEYKKSLGYQIALILYYAGVKKISHSIHFWVGRPKTIENINSISHCSISASPYIEYFDSETKVKENLLWYLLHKAKKSFSGCAGDKGSYMQVSTSKDREILNEIVMCFNSFINTFGEYKEK